jgi:hypothetical protein
MLDFIASAYAQQAITLPPVPTIGVSPVLQWFMGVASTILIVGLPLIAGWAKQYFNLQNVQTRANLINGSVMHAAATAIDDRAQGMPESQVVAKALDYVKSAHPNVVASVPQATDAHLTATINAEVSRQVQANTKPPVIVVPVDPKEVPAIPPRPEFTPDASNRSLPA